jgi:formiminotetrahydrofolate cyclodeaminase
MMTGNMTISSFLDALAAHSSTPGGGGAAALAGAQAAALVSMVINFTVGNKKYAAVEAEMTQHLQHSEALRHALLELADRDVEAFTAVAAGYALPRATDEEKAARTVAIQSALKGATLVPFATAEQCLEVLRLIAPVGAGGNSNVVSDAATALYLAEAGLRSALVNVNINLKSSKDEAFVATYTTKRDALLADAAAAYQAAKTACEETLGVIL